MDADAVARFISRYERLTCYALRKCRIGSIWLSALMGNGLW